MASCICICQQPRCLFANSVMEADCEKKRGWRNLQFQITYCKEFKGLGGRKGILEPDAYYEESKRKIDIVNGQRRV